MIVVTGSNGFIGSNLIKGLNKIGYKDIIAVDDHNDPSLKENIIHCEIKDYLNIDEFIKSIEKMILNKFKNIQNRSISCRIQEQLQNGFIKLYGDDTIRYGPQTKINFLLKISGIWVSNQTNDFGLTFRFFIFNNQF